MYGGLYECMNGCMNLWLTFSAGFAEGGSMLFC